MIGGYGINYAYLNTTSVYDPIANSWSHSTDMPTARGDLMCVALSGEIYVLGGYVVSKSFKPKHRYVKQCLIPNRSHSFYATTPRLKTINDLWIGRWGS